MPKVLSSPIPGGNPAYLSCSGSSGKAAVAGRLRRCFRFPATSSATGVQPSHPPSKSFRYHAMTRLCRNAPGNAMDYGTITSLPGMFFAAAERRGERPFLWAKAEGRYRPLSWAEAARQVNRLARGLVSLGIVAGDRVALAAESRPEWVVADLAIMTAGAITVPAYTTNTIDDHRHILGNS